MEKKKYIINGKTYCQKKLVILQVKQLMAALEGVVFHDLSATGVIKSLDDLVPSIAAIVLTPEGARIKTKDMAFLADEFENELDFEKALEVTAALQARQNLSAADSPPLNILPMISSHSYRCFILNSYHSRASAIVTVHSTRSFRVMSPPQSSRTISSIRKLLFLCPLLPVPGPSYPSVFSNWKLSKRSD
jgi:hypothetical protein